MDLFASFHYNTQLLKQLFFLTFLTLMQNLREALLYYLCSTRHNFLMCLFLGMPFNQLGTLAGSKFYNVEATYYYLRWWAAARESLNCWSGASGVRFFYPCLMCASIQSEAPFEGAYGNLKRLFDKAAKMYQQVKKQEMKKLSPARQRWNTKATMWISTYAIYGSSPLLNVGNMTQFTASL